jgi:sugar/nucleoside kinase (ribokinase family)
MSVLTVGETMVLFDPLTDGPPHLGMQLTLRIAGAESNFAIGLARLGVDVAWASRLGSDSFGDLVLRALADEGVDLAYVKRDEGRTGMFAKWRDDGRSNVAYWRSGSAASRLRPGDVPDDAIAAAQHLHLTGITMAISDSGHDLVVELARRASERGLTVTFDPNFRPALPDTAAAAAERQADVLPYVDWYLCSDEEARLLWGGEPLPARTAVRIGRRGVVVDGETIPPPTTVENVIDEVGSGDAFAAGFVYGLLHDWSPSACGRAGNLIAAYALGATGDWESLPRLAEVEDELHTIADRDARPTGNRTGTAMPGAASSDRS